MIIKEPNFHFANELSPTFPVSDPDISGNLIWIIAFDFDVFEAGREYGQWHESALLAFEGVISSTRKVRLYANQNTADGPGNYEIVDGPFNQPSSDQEFYQFNSSVYPNPTNAWVEWDIIARSVHVGQIDTQTLIDFAKQRGVEPAIAKSAVEDADRSAVWCLLDGMKHAHDYKRRLPVYCEELIQAAREKDRFLKIADVLFQRPNSALSKLADELSAYHTEGAAALIRDIIAAGIDVSDFVINAVYSGDGGNVPALLDPSEAVRIFSAQTLETRNDIPGLRLCLPNVSANVPEIAGGYIGPNKIGEAAHTLVKEISTEKFSAAPLTHAQVEALRSAIWALGVLRPNSVRPYLESLTTHDNQLIRETALNALSKLAQVMRIIYTLSPFLAIGHLAPQI